MQQTLVSSYLLSCHLLNNMQNPHAMIFFFFASLQDVHHGNGTQEIFEKYKSVRLSDFYLTSLIPLCELWMSLIEHVLQILYVNYGCL